MVTFFTGSSLFAACVWFINLAGPARAAPMPEGGNQLEKARVSGVFPNVGITAHPARRWTSPSPPSTRSRPRRQVPTRFVGSAERLYAEYADRECSCPTCARYNFAAGRLLRQDCLNACDAEVACTAFMYEVNFFSSNDCYLYSGEGGVRAGSVNTDSDCYVIKDCQSHLQCSSTEYCDTGYSCYGCHFTYQNGTAGSCIGAADAVDDVCPQHCHAAAPTAAPSEPTPSPTPTPTTCSCAAGAGPCRHPSGLCRSYLDGTTDCAAGLTDCGGSDESDTTVAAAEPTVPPEPDNNDGTSTSAPTVASTTEPPTTEPPTSELPGALTAAPTSTSPTTPGDTPVPTVSPTDAPATAEPTGSPSVAPPLPTGYPTAVVPANSTAVNPLAAPSPSCSSSSDQVCGADGDTYTNSCIAAFRGVAVAYAGACSNDNNGSTAADPSAAGEEQPGNKLGLAIGVGVGLAAVGIIATVVWQRRSRLQGPAAGLARPQHPSLDNGSPGSVAPGVAGAGDYEVAVALNPQYPTVTLNPGYNAGSGNGVGLPNDAARAGPVYAEVDDPQYAELAAATYAAPREHAVYAGPAAPDTGVGLAAYDTVEMAVPGTGVGLPAYDNHAATDTVKIMAGASTLDETTA